MAESKNNIITHGLSGKVGNIIVFSQRGGKTYVSKAPKTPTGAPSEQQKQQRTKFQQAVLYAKSVASSELYKHAAASKNISAYNVAVADLLNAPKIEAIDLTHYNGNIGGTIKITVTDDFHVVAVKVSIHNADGSLVEQGNAVQQGGYWVYTATVQNTDLSGDKITIQASDEPDNMSEKIQML